ncbi:unnamed protein product [Durusdinium trenchii]|uniref:Uncharacterized protein n=1 Tax=Durusdinium trenchii TaxID=1381693 RepID=A0ABP0S6X7_9DINO
METEFEGSSSGWLREEDAAIQEEDAERNAEQAERNASMRSMLKRRREAEAKDKVPEAEAPEAFMAVKAKAMRAKMVDEGQPPWFVPRPHIENSVLRLHEEILDFVDFMQHTREEVQARKKWVQSIKEACVAMWPACKVSVFGSFFTGLSLPNGDVDVAVSEVPCKSGTAMKMLADYMLSKGQISWLEIIETAKVPVMKVKEYPQMKPLLLFLKYFLLQRGLHETYTGGMGSYLLCNVVLHFLQRHPSLKNQRYYAGTSLGHLLFDFLKYYGQDFNYSTGISVLEGGATFSKADRFPEKAKRQDRPGVQLCLESPLSTSMDLGAACFRMPVLRNLFHHGYHCVCHLMVSRSPAEVSMLCPLLIDPAHPVITDRFKLMQEQPVAFVPKPKTTNDGAVSQNGMLPSELERPLKRSRKTEVPPAPRIQANEDEGIPTFGFHEDVSQWDLE